MAFGAEGLSPKDIEELSAIPQPKNTGEKPHFSVPEKQQITEEVLTEMINAKLGSLLASTGNVSGNILTASEKNIFWKQEAPTPTEVINYIKTKKAQTGEEDFYSFADPKIIEDIIIEIAKEKRIKREQEKKEGIKSYEEIQKMISEQKNNAVQPEELDKNPAPPILKTPKIDLVAEAFKTEGVKKSIYPNETNEKIGWFKKIFGKQEVNNTAPIIVKSEKIKSIESDQKQLSKLLQSLKDIYNIKMDENGKIGFWSQKEYNRLHLSGDQMFSELMNKIIALQTSLALANSSEKSITAPMDRYRQDTNKDIANTGKGVMR
ncbi:MAG: hypothetical protein UR53_C0002G0036 [Candidatus Magasanikbacteria bacterium GW2011_GWC2_34_16]|uniref:Uncharacterized protein n=2 Tax=Candidatus Magasanikiibacteriota TaxID=1752731 RepID=A0A0G0JWL3_9BACT|nr:MAG: hypothetical protein UR53_C0002G0036 [Candidatus Magasanikbacteria bacterium GW2011_GWC2_34_16]KKQ41239.1 MAG: hypothetical protein US58_C0003G0022 [Candidatus Magasanikbacteria bacterium GW2011_GWA2_37_8]